MLGCLAFRGKSLSMLVPIKDLSDTLHHLCYADRQPHEIHIHADAPTTLLEGRAPWHEHTMHAQCTAGKCQHLSVFSKTSRGAWLSRGWEPPARWHLFLSFLFSSFSSFLPHFNGMVRQRFPLSSRMLYFINYITHLVWFPISLGCQHSNLIALTLRRSRSA